MSERIDIFHHFELQGLATHYKTLNWTLHTIFIPMHIGMIGAIATVADHDGNAHGGQYALVFALVGCAAGMWLIWAWDRISNRHGYTVGALYRRLHELETHMADKYAENAEGFDVHLLVDRVDGRRKRRGTTTKRILGTLRALMLFAYFVLVYVLSSAPVEHWIRENFFMSI
ncbi:MAG TPA: hypothetical protein VG889_00080 [Rhizomicrobium sp.]|nr:hypothetical protein [Rhizomicrobium sp.]